MQVTALQQRAAFAGAFRPSRVAPVVARRAPLVCRAAAEVEEVGVSAVGSQEAVAHLRYQRGSVHKVRRVLDVIRGRSYEEAVAMLEYMPYKACEPLLVCLTSAGANGKNGKGVPLSKQFIAEAYADQGPVLKRFRPRAQGRGFKILKPTFHLTIKTAPRAE
ncbi:50S ribosomal protein L22 [Raphidocelis subcapitata]|uniref:Large ribosomal subunit protein uL22c n=1 Tax=Raphidocelis subcapitata TaxID=307507 RepID=A0A2V0P3H8_9CHLO|nr:50S ribosomal protein L22 [Raphidocelis subcapitata]|eukprot:GBF94416.1 50S ribosomal protein L22 [Raphidocelis subcapitata]